MGRVERERENLDDEEGWVTFTFRGGDGSLGSPQRAERTACLRCLLVTIIDPTSSSSRP